MNNLATTEVPMIRKKARFFPEPSQVDMRRVAVVVLGGGQGTRLYPLTQTRCKPAISFAGKYRLIDVAIANALHADCNKIYVITQFLSTSLHKHICSTYQGTNAFTTGFVDILSAEQRPTQHNWFQGTADAVRQNLYYLKEAPVDYFLILSGDQLYTMDFRQMFAFALGTDADLAVAALPVELQDAKRMGLMKIDSKNEIKSFVEKPQQPEILDTCKLSAATRRRLGLLDSDQKNFLGSMGIYLFKKQALFDLLEYDKREDFGKHLIPTKIGLGSTYAYLHTGYWEDIGTIKSFYDSNIALTYPGAPFNYYDDNFPVVRSLSKLPGAKISNTLIKNSIIGDGCVIDAEEISHTILGPRTIVKKGTVIHHSYLMGNDFYKPPSTHGRFPEVMQISEDCIIQKAIIDKDVYIGPGTRLINKNNLDHYDGNNVYIRDGIIIVARGASLPAGFTL